MNLKSLRAKMLALFDTPEQAASEEAAELVAYNTMRTLFDGVGDQWDAASKVIDDLISDEEDDPTASPEAEAAEEEVEDARLDAVRMHCYTMIAALQSVCNACTDQQVPDMPAPSDPRYMEQFKAQVGGRMLIGKSISAKNMGVIQKAHDASHEMHAHTVALGAQCNGMKLLESDNPELRAAASASSEEDSMTRCDQIGIIKGLAGANYTAEQVKAIEGLPDVTVATLHALAGKSPADGIIQAKANADAALAAHAHGLNSKDQAEAAAAAAKAKEDAADGGKDDAEEGKDGKKMKAAQAAEEKEREAFFAKNPELKTLIDRQRAQDAARKLTLVTALKGGPLDEKQLAAKPLEELETLAAYAGVEKDEPVDYSGRGMPRAAEASDAPPDGYALALEARKKSAVN